MRDPLVTIDHLSDEGLAAVWIETDAGRLNVASWIPTAAAEHIAAALRCVGMDALRVLVSLRTHLGEPEAVERVFPM